jgi:hypothetical protein
MSISRLAPWRGGTVRIVLCKPCHGHPEMSTSVYDKSPTPDAKPKEQIVPPIKSGVAGQSALEEYQRLHANREARINLKFGRFAGVVKFLTDDPQSITAWKVGSAGERQLAASLEESLGDRAVFFTTGKFREQTATSTISLWPLRVFGWLTLRTIRGSSNNAT